MKLQKKQAKKHSKKEHLQDHEKNDNFADHNTHDKKIQEQKLTKGKFFGKRWFPFGNG